MVVSINCILTSDVMFMSDVNIDVYAGCKLNSELNGPQSVVFSDVLNHV